MPKHPMIDKATVARRDVVTEAGCGTEYFVRCPDGYLVACGGEDRANAIADSINMWLEGSNSNVITGWPPPPAVF